MLTSAVTEFREPVRILLQVTDFLREIHENLFAFRDAAKPRLTARLRRREPGLASV